MGGGMMNWHPAGVRTPTSSSSSDIAPNAWFFEVLLSTGERRSHSELSPLAARNSASGGGGQRPDGEEAAVERESKMVQLHAAQTRDAFNLHSKVFTCGSFDDGGQEQQNAWLERTRWESHLEGLDPELLHNLLATPDTTSDRLLREMNESLEILPTAAHGIN
ncbi:unnamed protein product [Clonostachys rosea f. rosea IK726]|uniref:Uncharacterized protein n=1 Tax=Clonostachys rosea f. rosea IK726 TaxID=1349383 RepID=A0ACA9UW72_BIOOC|nr:unnamed protein product [Clonostachys rosea f. rosea IK726]